MKTYNIYLDILVGRPGCGKTTYAQEFKKNSFESGSIEIIDCDEYLRNKKKYDESTFDTDSFGYFLRTRLEGITGCLKWWEKRRYIVDGLFPTVEDRTKLINKFISLVNQAASASKHNGYEYTYSLDIRFIIWNDDIEACLANDERRSKKFGTYRSVAQTIKNMVIEPVDVNIYKDYYKVKNVSCMYMDIYSPSENKEKIMSKASYSETHIMKSDTWSLGGTWCSYDGSESTVSPEEPIEFTEFDDLLTEMCPNISFLQYKKLHHDTVTQVTKDESDYYGGTTTEAHWECDLEKLYNELVEMNIIEP